jgi:hypothetical protein
MSAIDPFDPEAMRRHDARTVALVVLLICLLVFLGPLLDAYDADTERMERDRIDAEVQARIDHRIERAARAVCAEQHGPGAVPVWTAEHSLLCVPALGMPIARQGGN